MSNIDVNNLQSLINSGNDISSIVKDNMPAGTYSKFATFLIDNDRPGFVTYCPGGIDPNTGQCRNTGLSIPDPLGHLAGALLLHNG